MVDYEELKAKGLSRLELEEAMNEAYEITVIHLLYALGFEEQGIIWIEEGDYDFMWDIYDEVNKYNPDLPFKRIKTGYIFLPETLEVMKKEDY